MYYLILIIMLVQLSYIIYSFKKGHENYKLKTIIRFSTLFLLSILFVTKIIPWDIRWQIVYFAFVILFVLSLISLKRKTNRNSQLRIILMGIGSLIFITSSMSLLIIFPLYPSPEPSGSYKVLTKNVTYIDSTRTEENGKSREVNTTYWYPEVDSGKFPLVVFDHGFNGVRDSNESTFKELASYGYVVCSLDHPYQSLYTENEKGEVTLSSPKFLEEYKELGTDLDKNIKYLKKWVDVRIKDTNLVIDETIKKNEGVYSLIDKNKIGIMGHSLGATTATAITRLRKDIDSVVNIDGPMPYEITGVENGKYHILTEKYPVPILFIYSQYLYENGVEKDDPLYIINKEVAKKAPRHYEIVFIGAQHLSLTDLVFASPIMANVLDGGRKATIDKTHCIKTMNNIIREYFDDTLKDSKNFKYESLTYVE